MKEKANLYFYFLSMIIYFFMFMFRNDALHFILITCLYLACNFTWIFSRKNKNEKIKWSDLQKPL